jgi:carboxypeptidase Taq
MQDLEIVKKYQKEIILLGRAGALLGWDQQVYMPEQGINSRAETSSFLSCLIHEKLTNNEFFEVLKRLKKKDLKGDDKIMVEKVYEDILKSRKLPKEFIEEISKNEALGFSAWQEAKKKNKFEIFGPYLKKLVELNIKKAKLLGCKGHLYNALLDNYEEGMSVEQLKPKFEKLKVDLIDLLKRIENSKNYKKITKHKIKISDNEQMELVGDVAKRIGLEKINSRIDFAEHPFTTKIGEGDVRITTNIRDDIFFSFTSTVHEAGHALYELQMPQKHKFDFLGEAPSFGLHESQSRLWENMIGKSECFWRYYSKKFDKSLGKKKGKDFWYNSLNCVFPGKVRIESDEVHYCLHIILRFEIELGLIDGSIKVKDLPKVWNKKMKEFFGVRIKKDFEGVLQDVHWSGGSFGYFPTYAIGTIYAAQIYETMKKEIKDLEKKISRGDFKEIREWLRENIHKHGRKYLANDLIKKITGRGLDIENYVRYLNEKYGKIYGF